MKNRIPTLTEFINEQNIHDFRDLSVNNQCSYMENFMRYKKIIVSIDGDGKRFALSGPAKDEDKIKACKMLRDEFGVTIDVLDE
ncbi:MAG: hypothetical protein WC979_01605 [Candidatus Pacearchaeota archaeon]|jgi:hypothetical protein|nr:hypothetical protein [Clostridia bacterium]